MKKYFSALWKVISGLASAFFLLSATVFFPSVASVVMLILSIWFIPIPTFCRIKEKFLPSKILRTILPILLLVIAVLVTPSKSTDTTVLEQPQLSIETEKPAIKEQITSKEPKATQVKPENKNSEQPVVKEETPLLNENEKIDTKEAGDKSIKATLSDDVLYNDFAEACEQTDINIEKIKDFEQVDDWIAGKRYSFTYDNLGLRLYANMNSTVNTIKLGNDIDLYKQGYEPYSITDYIIDLDTSSQLRVMTEDYVKNQLNFPKEANFPWLDWNYGRNRDIYTIQSHVEGKNAFGVKADLQFTLMYRVFDGSAELIYFELDNSILIDERDKYTYPERVKISESQEFTEETDSAEIHLVDGQLGKYGKTVTLDGNDFINYFIPSGTYTVTNNGKWCNVYIAKNEYYTNSSGYQENEIIQTLEFKEYGETATITIESGQHIELTVYANVTLTPKK